MDMIKWDWPVRAVMTEEEWLNSEHPLSMLEFLHGRASERKLRLFAYACCRRIWDLLTDERSRRAVQAAEQFADGCLPSAQFALVRASAQEAFLEAKREEYAAEAEANFCHTAEYCAVCAKLYALAAARLTASTRADPTLQLTDAYRDNEEEWEGSSWPTKGCSYWTIAAVRNAEMARVYSEDSEIDFREAFRIAETRREQPEAVAHISLLHDIFGNPFCPLTINPHVLEWNEGIVRKLAQAIYIDRAFDRLPILADALEEAGCTKAEILKHCRQRGEHVRGCWVVDLILGKS
jgi:hypothetical protein